MRYLFSQFIPSPPHPAVTRGVPVGRCSAYHRGSAGVERVREAGKPPLKAEAEPIVGPSPSGLLLSDPWCPWSTRVGSPKSTSRVHPEGDFLPRTTILPVLKQWNFSRLRPSHIRISNLASLTPGIGVSPSPIPRSASSPFGSPPGSHSEDRLLGVILLRTSPQGRRTGRTCGSWLRGSPWKAPYSSPPGPSSPGSPGLPRRARASKG